MRKAEREVKNMIDLHPTKCNICGGRVVYTKVENVYGKKNIKFQTSGYCYHCTECGAVVGTHKDKPDEAMGILADREMCDMRQKSHKMFDNLWKNKEERTQMYQKLADELGIPFEECHFAHFDKEQLRKIDSILVKLWREKYDN